MKKKIVIEPVTRVEGHGKVTIHLDEDGRVSDSFFHIVEFRGFEKFIQGRQQGGDGVSLAHGVRIVDNQDNVEADLFAGLKGFHR